MDGAIVEDKPCRPAGKIAVAEAYVPATQSVQASKETVALYLPAAHTTQFWAFGPVNPGLQMQLVQLVEPLADCESAGQAWQTLDSAAPTVAEKVSALQFVQDVTPSAVENLPAVQLVQSAAPSSEYVPAPQLAQVFAEEAPSVAENLPAVQ